MKFKNISIFFKYYDICEEATISKKQKGNVSANGEIIFNIEELLRFRL